MRQRSRIGGALYFRSRPAAPLTEKDQASDFVLAPRFAQFFWPNTTPSQKHGALLAHRSHRGCCDCNPLRGGED
jgi:hypothetical protein